MHKEPESFKEVTERDLADLTEWVKSMENSPLSDAAKLMTWRGFLLKLGGFEMTDFETDSDAET